MADRHVLRAFIDRLGGEDFVCARLGIKKRTILWAYEQGKFSAAWYAPLSDLADEKGLARPSFSLFKMKKLRAAEEIAA